MDHHSEAYILSLWYTLVQVLFAITPPIYLMLSFKPPNSPIQIRGCRIMLPFLTSFASFCLFTEAYNLARPIYVCFFPVRGETFHHPEETRLRIQWVLDLLAGALAAVAGVMNFAETFLVGEPNESQAISAVDKDAQNIMRGASIEKIREGRKEMGPWDWLSKCSCVGEKFMIGAWIVGMCAYWVMSGRNKGGKFGL